ncbi:MAG: DEAD/DEAH box helicase family protein [Desulfuromonadales bacterium]|nr:DEAD/DEAH box helicase family protein [Desulfuromonadales bacterium]
MKLELMDFQLNAVDLLIKRLKQAKRELDDGDPQAVILSSPTGSGKTVITTALMEEILEGSEQFDGEPDAVFLWLSDQPELNEQSRKKIADTCSRFRPHDLIIIDSNFDRETFEGGKVFFLNIQKLGKDKLLTSKGDMRQYTIWETIANTSKTLRGKFYLIVDEAHRGMRQTKNEANAQESILQKFVKGSGEIPPIDLILGMSATPQRFVKMLESETNRTPRKCEIPTEEVRASGLLKERIILFYPDANDPSDMTLLATAARRWKEIRDAWNVYTEEQKDKQPVHPAMVIQVEDGSDNRLTKTDLEQALKTLEQELGPISDEELAHSFQEDQAITVGHHKIRKIEASRIQEETGIKIILFKMALTTGWDCPRAEVMMSFRRAQDHTLIAQLIGRMIRTPLARRIEGRELLNTVSLYLPHYDKEGVNQVVTRLKSDPDYVPPIDVEEGAKLVIFRQDQARKDAIDELSGLPVYKVDKIRKASNTRRLMRLSRLLYMHEIDIEASEESKKLIIETLDEEKDRLRRDDPDFDRKVAECTEIKVNAVTIEQGTWRDLGGSSITVRRDDHNIDDLFNRAGQTLGEGLNVDYWQAHYDEDDPTRPKLELVFILQNQQASDALEKECGRRIENLFIKYKTAIRNLTSSEREKYNKVKGTAKEQEALEMLPPAEIMVGVDKNDGSGYSRFDKHLYVDGQGEYWAKLNTWETAVIQAEIDKQDVVGWLRNYDRKHWALSMSYEFGGTSNPMYPDFLVVRQKDDGYLVDILEPHSSSLNDNYAKARGLAKYAQQHYSSFGRIELIRVVGGKIKRIDLNDDDTRRKVLMVNDNAGLDLVFDVVS